MQFAAASGGKGDSKGHGVETMMTVQGEPTIRAHGPEPDRTGSVTPGMVTWGADETLLSSTRSDQQ